MGSENDNIFRHIKNAVIYSIAGFKAAWINEMAFRTEAIVIAIMFPIGICCRMGVAHRFLYAGSDYRIAQFRGGKRGGSYRCGTPYFIKAGKGFRFRRCSGQYADRCDCMGSDCISPISGLIFGERNRFAGRCGKIDNPDVLGRS